MAYFPDAARRQMALRSSGAERAAAMTHDDKFAITKGTGNVFRDVGLPDADTELLKADLSAAILRAQREQGLTNAAAAAQKAGVDEGDISRIRSCDLDRVTIDRLGRILNRLDPEVSVVVDVVPQSQGGPRLSSARTDITPKIAVECYLSDRFHSDPGGSIAGRHASGRRPDTPDPRSRDPGLCRKGPPPRPLQLKAATTSAARLLQGIQQLNRVHVSRDTDADALA
jgi:predicted XRE-type DNA-binding protein